MKAAWMVVQDGLAAKGRGYAYHLSEENTVVFDGIDKTGVVDASCVCLARHQP